MNRETPRWIVVARILRPRGNKGEVAAQVLTDFPERLTKLTEVFLGRAGNAAEGSTETTARRIGVQSCWLSQNHRGQAVLHFEGVNSINDAEKFRGLDVLLPFEQRVALPAGQYFAADLIGCSIFENSSLPPVLASSPCSLSEAPGFLGIVRDVQFIGDDVSGTPLLEVETAQGELLIPLADDICTRIDITAHRIDVTLPDGLQSLNRD